MLTMKPMMSKRIADGAIVNNEINDPDWPYMFVFNDWRKFVEMTKYCAELLGDGACRDKDGNTKNDDDNSAKWACGTGTKIYWKSDYLMKQCCMQLILSEW